jgi:hypothetical protein
MKKLIIASVLFLMGLQFSNAQTGYTYVNGYYSSYNNSFVEGHFRTLPNNTNWDNWSTSGNYNLFTGSTGYVAPDYSWGAYNYGSGQTIYTGPRGGQYYYNSNGNKTYVPKR